MMVYDNFKKAVNMARENSGLLFGFSSWHEIQVEHKGKVFMLNPFVVNLKRMTYNQTVVNIVSGYLHRINLRECLDSMGEK